MDKFSTICGVPIRYGSFGKGDRVIVLLHGYLEASEVWEHFGGLLGKRYRVVTLDLPGSGWSGYKGDVVSVDFMADVVVGVMEEMGIDKGIIVGHSMGGYVALNVADRYCGRVDKLVLLHSTANCDSDEKRELRKREIALVEEGKKDVLAKVNPSRGFAKCNVAKCEEAIEELYEQIIMSDDDAIVAVLKGLGERVDMNDAFEKMNIERLMIFGDDDNYIPLEAAKAMEERFAPCGVEVAWIAGSGHMSFIEKPRECADVLERFIDK